MGRNVNLMVDLQCIGVVSVDVEQMHQVFSNLVLNARDAMPKGGELTVRCRHASAVEIPPAFHSEAQSQYVHCEVRDTGSGIPAGIREKIFEPLFTTKKSGTGIGLSVVQRLVLANGGDLEVESEEGKGTTFHIFLPLHEE